MAHPLVMLAIGLVFGGGLGFTVAATNGVTLDGHDHGDHDRDTHTRAAPAGVAAIGTDGTASAATPHTHASKGAIALSSGQGAPVLHARLAPDPVSGWNLHVATERFRFAPEAVGSAHVPGEGHGHVMVDGVKVARLYGPWMHLPALAPDAVVEVSLHANDHRDLALDGVALRVRARRGEPTP